MADTVAFELREGLKGKFDGGQIAKPDGTTLDLGARLKDKDVIETSDSQEIELLRGVEALKEVSPGAKSAGVPKETAQK